MPMLERVDDGIYRRDRYIRERDAAAVEIEFSPRFDFDSWDPLAVGAWCIYGCPSDPAMLDVSRVLWAVCGHPTDLSDGASARHHAAWPTSERANGVYAAPPAIPEEPAMPTPAPPRHRWWRR